MVYKTKAEQCIESQAKRIEELTLELNKINIENQRIKERDSMILKEHSILKEENAKLSERLYNEQTDILESDRKLDKVVKFLDSLYADGVIPRHFRFGLAEIRCDLCCISECSTRNDPEECLRTVTQKESKGES